MKKIAIAVTSLMVTSSTQASISDNDFKQELTYSLNVKQFLRELPLEDIEESKTIKSYINSEEMKGEAEWVDGFVRAEWNKSF